MTFSGLSFRLLRSSAEDYFFKPVSPYPAAVFRILFGACVCGTLLLIHADWLNWFGAHGWVSPETIEKAETGFRLNLFAMVPETDGWTGGLYWVLLAAAVSLVLGLGTRVSNVVVFLGLNSMNQRMPLIMHGGDIFLRSVGFFLIFADSGAALSVDAAIRSRRLRGQSNKMSPPGPERLISPWPLRLIQVQLAVMYLASFCWKAKGSTWWYGTALFYALHLREVRQFPVPQWFYQPLALRLGSWSVLAFELCFPLLVWFRQFKEPMLIVGLVFHLCLEYTLNVPMFQWDVLAAYVLFLDFDGSVFTGRGRRQPKRGREEGRRSRE